MAELRQKQENLTTADLAGRKENAYTKDRDLHQAEVEDVSRPKLVKSETVTGPRSVPTASPSALSQEAHENGATPLFTESDIGDLRSRWSNVQTGFVDAPRQSVEEADKLVATVMQRLAEGFANERATLERAWDRGDNVSTEDLRVAFRRYRSFFDRLLKA